VIFVVYYYLIKEARQNIYIYILERNIINVTVAVSQKKAI
jgi:hypothetical protein